ncbi:MAG: PilZ domain-containing protein [Candidatus Omnitrophota bacterium]|jgi:c-di-GMP-binding flagellar brake protein YcgR
MYNRYWGRDRRRFQRLNFNLTVWYKVLIPVNLRLSCPEEDREATTLDISPLGMAFISRSSLPLYTSLVLKFIVFTSCSNIAIPIEVNGEVRSCMPYENREYRIGVCFKGIEPEKQRQLEDFVKESLRPVI